MARSLWTTVILALALSLAGLMVRGLSVSAATDGGARSWGFAPPQAESMRLRGWSDTPTDGPITDWYEDGVRRYEGHLLRGEPDGSWRYWWENGQLRWRGSYRLGQLDGRTEGFYENGELEFVATYKNGVLHGPTEKRDETGRLLQTGAYMDGRKRGAFIFYGRDGKIDADRSGLYDGDERVADLPPERLQTHRVARRRR